MRARLPIRPLEKVWGTQDTEPWYRNPEQLKIGEVWFEASDRTPLLVKFLFTSGDLSVQVHPGDEYARENENGSRGKTEMWHVLRAGPGAKIAVGLNQMETPERVREAALSGEILTMLRWIEVSVGDTFFLPAGTVHAIGAGLAICEVQQLSDVTYRLYDFGRDRELHLDRSLDVADLAPYDGKTELPLQCPYFRVEKLNISGTAAIPASESTRLCIVIEGSGTMAGTPFQTGDGWEIAAGAGPVSIDSASAVLLIAQT